MARPASKNPKKTLISYRIDEASAEEIAEHIGRRYGRFPPSPSEFARACLGDWLVANRADIDAAKPKKGAASRGVG